MLLVIMATMVCGSPVSRSSGMITRAGRRFAVRRFESGKRTSTTSPYLKGIVGVHFRALPILFERFEPSAKTLGLLRADLPLSEIDRAIGWQERHDHAGFVGGRRRFQKLDFPVSIDAFN